MFFQKRYEAVSGFPVGQGPVGRGDGHSGTGTAQAVGQDVARLFGPDEQNFRGPGKVGYEAACQRFGTVLGRYQVCPQSVGAEGLCRGASDDAQPDASQGPAVFLKFTASTSTATTNKFQIAPTIVGVFCLYTAHEQIDKSKPPPFIECKI